MIVPASDRESMDLPEFSRQNNSGRGCLRSIEQAAQIAEGRDLRKGPRGGEGILRILAHVMEAELAYMAMIREGEVFLPQGRV